MIKLFRLITLLEGSSYLLLLFIAVPLKYLVGDESFVKLLGMPHGVLFILYIVFAFVFQKKMKWSLINFLIILVASVVPFGTFYIDKKYFMYLSVITLIIYWFIMLYIPIPGIGQPDLSVPELNMAHYIDKNYLPGVMWQGTWDPEGILTTIPSIITGVFGLIAGSILISNSDIKDKLLNLFYIGLILVFVGDFFSWSFPVNKNLWSTSYTFLMGGMSFMLTAAFTYLIDVNGYKKFKMSQVFGTNSIFTYVLAGILGSIFYSDFIIGVQLNSIFVNTLVDSGVYPKVASLLYAMLYVVIIYIPAYYLFTKKIFIKL